MKLTRSHLFTLAAISMVLFSIGCSERNPTELPQSQGNTDPVVFTDPPEGNAYEVYWQPFFETSYTGFAVDSVYAYGDFQFYGARSLKFNVPPAESALGLYLGGVITSTGARNLAEYNALTFYVRANQEVVTAGIDLDLVGFGNDNTGNSLYEAGTSQIPLTTEWTQVIVPIPRSDRLLSERGLFTVAEGLERNGGPGGPPKIPGGYDFWVDEIRFAKVNNLGEPRPAMTASSGKTYFVGSNVTVSGTNTAYTIDGQDVVVDHSPGYFDFATSDETVATPTIDGARIVGAGEVDITATLKGVAVTDTVSVTGILGPTAPAPSPTHPAGDVISLYSDVYDDVPGTTWRAQWSTPSTEHGAFVLGGNAMHMYTIPRSTDYIGIVYGEKIDASQMTHFHLDVFAPFGTVFTVKMFARDDTATRDSNSNKVPFNASTDPAFAAGAWYSLDIPLESFIFPPTPVENPTAWLAGFVLETADASLLLVDNIYWHK